MLRPPIINSNQSDGLVIVFFSITLPLFIYSNNDRFPAVVYFCLHFMILLLRRCSGHWCVIKTFTRQWPLCFLASAAWLVTGFSATFRTGWCRVASWVIWCFHIMLLCALAWEDDRLSSFTCSSRAYSPLRLPSLRLSGHGWHVASVLVSPCPLSWGHLLSWVNR